MNIDFISFLSIFIPTAVGIFLFRSVLTVTKILILFVWITAIIEVTATVLFYQGINNLFTFHLHTYFEFLLLSLMYSRLITSTLIKNVIRSVIPVFIGFSLLNSLFWEDITGFNSIQRHVEGLLLEVYICIYLIQVARYRESFKENPFLILSSALILYFTGNLFLFIYGKTVLTTGTGEMWVVHGVLNIILNLSFAIIIARSRVQLPKKWRLKR